MKNTNLPVLDAIESKFSGRIESLVGYGSYFFDRNCDSNDIDICLLLDSRSCCDSKDLHDIIATHNASSIDITIHYLDEIEWRGWENFQHGTHGVFFLCHLANAVVLKGSDIFARKSAQVPIQKYRESLISQIWQYIDRMQINLMHDNLISKEYFRKYLTRTMVDMLLLESEISYREVNKNSAIKLMEDFIDVSSLFSDDSKTLYKKIMTKNFDRQGVATALQYIIEDLQNQLRRKKNEL